MAAEFTPEKYRDAYREQLEKLIAERSASQPASAISTPPPSKPAADIMEALRKSLAAVKKPAASAPPPAPERVRTRKGR
jgi:DNA end-binding protein Ku